MMILGKKMRMTQVWKEDKVIPVTLIHAAPNTVSLVRTKNRDGYSAAQLALGKIKKEFRADPGSEVSVSAGDTVTVAGFAEGDLVRISGYDKGRGFQGVVKRHGFHGGPKTHGQKNRLRHPGSIGSTAFQRVVPGRRMAGRMGNERVTTTKRLIVGVDMEKNTLTIKGPLPGAPGGILEIRKIVIAKKK